MKNSIVLFLVLLAHSHSVHSQDTPDAQLPRGVRTLTGDEIALRDAAWTLLLQAVRTERSSGREAALARIERSMGLDSTNAERFLVYSVDAEEDLRLFGRNAMDELVCAKRNDFSTGREFGAALEERSRRYNDRKAELISGLTEVLDSQSVQLFDQRTIEQRDSLSSLTVDGAEAWDGATPEDMQAAIARVCSVPGN